MTNMWTYDYRFILANHDSDRSLLSSVLTPSLQTRVLLVVALDGLSMAFVGHLRFDLIPGF